MTTTLAAPGAAYSAPAPAASPNPWYRRTWVIVVGAIAAGALLFGAGFVAGSVVSGLGRPPIGQYGPAGPGHFPGDGDGPPGSPQDGRSPFGQDGTGT